MSKWKYFSDEESEGLDYGLMVMIDKAREICGFPFVITSGKRTSAQNMSSGGVPDSSHITGLAVDLRLPTGQDQKEKMMWALGRAGFRRVLTYSRHVHVDVDQSKKQDIFLFMGESH